MFKVMQLQTIWFLGFMSLYVFSSINIYAHTSLKKYSLQIVSPVYGKKPYIQVPTAWISNKAKLEIIKTMHKKFGQKWKIQVVSIYEEKWEKSLKIHPAMNIGIYPIKKSKKSHLLSYTQRIIENLLKILLLIILPRLFTLEALEGLFFITTQKNNKILLFMIYKRCSNSKNEKKYEGKKTCYRDTKPKKT